MRSSIKFLAPLLVLAVVAAACSSSDGGEDADAAQADSPAPSTTSTTTTTTASTTTTAAPTATTTVEVDDGLDVRELVEELASDEMNGRDNQTPGSAAARELLVGELARFADPVFPEAGEFDGYLQEYEEGTNILAVIPGGELADEFVMIGAHYDHHGNDCRGVSEDDNICNGAADNAAGVAVAVKIARSIAEDGPPRRSVIIALWDGEEDGLVGSRAYVADPAIPLAQTVAYVNFDIQGANLLPSLTNATILVGAETGGPNLIEAARRAIEATALDTSMFSLLFGQGRSDHAVLVQAGVPSVFFTDANTGCYHTVKDDIDAVDFAKLDQQIINAEALSRDLIATDDPPALDTAAPPTNFDDAVELLRLVSVAEPDFGLLPVEALPVAEQFLVDLQGVVDAGADAFDADANGILLLGAVQFVSALAEVDCDSFVS